MLNFNVDPYYDDFDPSKNFHRILFKPGFAVQARELTQSQTILQDQISKFANNIFTQNTPVTGGKVTTNLNCYYLKLNTKYGDKTVIAAEFLNKIIQDTSGTILARVIATAEATTVNGLVGDPPTLIVSYLSGIHFTDGMLLTPVDGTNIFATTIGVDGGTTCTGLSSTASISDGVFYVVNGYSQSSTENQDGTFSKYSIGNFVSVTPQTIILEKYSNTPTYRVGLNIFETVYDSINDPSLLDPAIGASNYQAPGADRYVIKLTLTTLPLTLGNDSAFIELLRIQNGNTVKQVDGTVYSVIDDYFAKRDYETNGDYIVDDFKLTPSANTSSSDLYDVSISKGIAYVHGYRVENQSDYKITNARSRDTDSINNNTVFIDYGSYFYVDNVAGTFDVTTMPTIDLHCVPPSNINSANVKTYTSTLIGNAYIRNLSYSSSSTDANTNSYIFKAYVSDVNTNILTSNATSGTTNTITFYDPAGKFSSVANAYYGTAITLTSGTSQGDSRRIVSYNGSTKTATVDSAFTITPDTTSNFSLNFSTRDVESLVKVNGSYAVTASAIINNTGKTNGIYTGDTILENPGSPEMVFTLGYPYVATISNSDYVSTKVFRSKAFTNIGGIPTITISIPSGNPIRFLGNGALSSDTVKQNYTVIDKATGKVLDFCTTGNTITISAGHDTATLTSNTYSGKTVDIITTVSITNADSTNYVLKGKNLVTGNTATISTSGPSGIISSTTYIDLTKGQVYIKNAGINVAKTSLYVSDVKKIIKIIDTKDSLVTPTLSMLSQSAYDVTNLFVFDNGQRDNLYDHASLSLIPGAPKPKGNLLVIFDYYAHTGGDGYFSVMSYLSPISSSPESYVNIPTYISKSGTTYKLSDSVDFRPTRKNAQIAYVFDYTGNPSSDDTGTLIPTNLSEYVSDYSYYLGRKDKLVLTKDKSFLLINGTPSVNPAFPVEPDGSMVIANITHDPYTAYIPGEVPSGAISNLSIDKVIHKRWAKSDITDLQTRVNNLEYYASLSVLEQNAQSLQVPDVNGLNRFKNGILVDDFSSYLTADTSNPDYGSNINIRLKQLSPISLVNNFQLQNPIVMDSLGTIKSTNTFAVSSIGGARTNIFTLPYSTANAIIQPLASSTISVNPFGVAVYEGVAKLNPPMDNWVDNQQAPAILVTDPNMQIYQQTVGANYTNTGDFATIPGTTTSTSTSSSTRGSTGITTNTTTYTTQLQQQNITTTAGYSPISTTFGINNGYLTNVAVLPYIRPQQIIVKSKGMLVNAPVSTWFDGVSVDEYMTTPNTIELTNVSGTFTEDDIVGFYVAASGIFYPVSRVISVYKYPNTSNYRLYVASILGAPGTVSTSILQNAFFDSNGAYSSSTASGTVSTNSLIALSTSGVVSGVGGSYTPVGSSTPVQLYKTPNNSSYCTFLNQYGVWGDPNNSSSYSASFTVNFPTTGTYTLISSADNSAVIRIDGATVLNASGFTTTYSTSQSVSAGDHTVSWVATNTGESAGFALTIQDSNGNIIFSTTNPPNVTYTGVGQEIVMTGGGAWFTGVTRLKLDNSASSVANYYVGTKINITSKYVYDIEIAATYVPPPAPAPSGGGGGKIICKKLAELGYFDAAMNEADQKFGAALIEHDYDAYAGYISWAQTVVDLMEGKGSERLRKIVLFWEKDEQKRIEIQKNIVIYYMDRMARPWAEEMAYIMKAEGYTKSNFAGKMIMKIGLPMCRAIGKFKKVSIPNIVKILSIWGIVTVLLVTVSSISTAHLFIKKALEFFKK